MKRNTSSVTFELSKSSFDNEIKSKKAYVKENVNFNIQNATKFNTSKANRKIV